MAFDGAILAEGALFVEAREAFIEPAWDVRKIGLDQGVGEFMDERAGAGADVHDHDVVVAEVAVMGDGIRRRTIFWRGVCTVLRFRKGE